MDYQVVLSPYKGENRLPPPGKLPYQFGNFPLNFFSIFPFFFTLNYFRSFFRFRFGEDLEFLGNLPVHGLLL